MVNTTVILGIAIACVTILILIEIIHLFKSKKPSRIIVPTPSKIKSPPRPSRKPQLNSKLGSRVSTQDIGREKIKKRMSEKHISEKSKKDRLQEKLKELKNKKIPKKTRAMELARESTEFQTHESGLSEAVSNKEPEIYEPAEETPELEVDKFNELLIQIYNDINTGMVSDAKEHYQKLLKIYTNLVPKVENKEDLYNAVKDVREALIAVLN